MLSLPHFYSMNWLKRLGLPILSLGLATALPTLAQAQLTAGGDGTIITPNGNTIHITGGTQAGSNLFHSFGQFNVNAGQTANFVDPGVQNILGRVTGGNASLINGILQVSGGNANLYLMNPAGIIFGAGASLNVAGSFTATTANGIGLGNHWFNAIGSNDYPNLIGTPNSFAFTMQHPGAIVNAGNLAVNPGRNITLLGGTVINTGTLTAPGGKITVATVPGKRVVNISQEGSLLSLALPVEVGNTVNALPFTPLALPQLLTGGNVNSATRVTVEDGAVKLTGSGLPVNPGDVVATNITANTATLSAAHNLTLVESQLQTTGDLNLLANETVTVRDSIATPVRVQAGGNLTIQGNQGIDILALNHRTSGKPFQAGNNLALVSDGVISGDAHFGSQGNFQVQTLNGTPATFISLNDPVISSNGNVLFNGTYTGASLKVEAIGSIVFTGGITINNPDPGAIDNNAADQALLQNGRALILRAGRTSLDNPNNVPTGDFTNPGGTTTPGTISVNGDITTTGGPLTVVMSATGDVNIREINTGFDDGSVIIETPGNITARRIEGDTISLSSTAGRLTLGDPSDSTVDSGGTTISVANFNASARNGIRAYGELRSYRVELLSTAGDIVVHTLSVGAGGLDVNAAGLFQARGGAERANVFLDARIGNNPEISSFLQSKGINLSADQSVTIGYETGAPDESLPIIYSIGGAQAQNAPAGSLNAPITIRFEGATRTLVDNTFPIVSTDGSETVTQGRILIQGGNGAFFIGPTITGSLVPTIGDPFVMRDASGSFVPVTAANFTPTTILYRNQVYTAAFPTSEFPDNISGLAGSIYVGFGSNTTVYGTSQNRLFGTVSPTSSPTSSSTTASVSPGSSVTSIASESVQRNFVSQKTGIACDGTAIASATEVTGDRSGRAVSSSAANRTSCNTATDGDDAQILKLLDGGVR